MTQPQKISREIAGANLITEIAVCFARAHPSKREFGGRSIDTKIVSHYFRVVKNITITLPDDIGRKTRILAAEAETSVSQYLCRLVTEKITEETKYQAAMIRFLNRKASPLQAKPAPYPTRDSLHDRHALR